jgi:anti-sigma-K factor RskA
MRTRRPEPHTLAGAYALDALTRADRARFERHLARCPQCAAEISGLRETTTRLAAAAATAAPARLIQRAVATAAQTRQLPPLTPDTPRPWPGRPAAVIGASPAAGMPGAGSFRRAWLPRLALALAGAMVILASVLGLAARSTQHQLQQNQQVSHAIAAVLTARDATMITAPVTTGGTATIVMSAHDRALVFAAAGLPALPPSSYYELWLMRPGRDQPAAKLPAPRHGMTGPVLASGLRPGDHLGLTIEPAGGSLHLTTPAILQVAL